MRRALYIALALAVWTFVVFSAGMFYSDFLAWKDSLSRPATTLREAPDPLPYAIPAGYDWDLRWWSEKTGVPLSVACRMFSVETSESGTPEDSRWNPLAVSYAGAEGLAQLLRDNLTSPLFVSLNDGRPIDPFDPHQAIKVGLRYLRWLYDQHDAWHPMDRGALRLALGAYNTGPSRPSSRWVAETVRYVRDITGGRP